MKKYRSKKAEPIFLECMMNYYRCREFHLKALKSYGFNAKFYEGVGHEINHEISDEINQFVIKIIKGEGFTLSSRAIAKD